MDRGTFCTRDACMTDRTGNAKNRAGRQAAFQEGLDYMLRVTCDGCGKELRPGEHPHVLKMGVSATHAPAELTEADLDSDHMEAVSELLREIEELDEPIDLEPPSRHLRYD